MELILKKKLINHSQMWTVLKKDVKKTRLTKKTQFSQKLLEKKKWLEERLVKWLVY